MARPTVDFRNTILILTCRTWRWRHLEQDDGGEVGLPEFINRLA